MTVASWQSELQGAVKSVEELVERGFLSTERAAALSDVARNYRVLLPQYYLNLIDKENPKDPVARMALPSVQELLHAEESLRDPIGDLAKQAAPRLTHRYKDRALLHVTNLCPMYCRFCFRKNLMNEKEEALYDGDFSAAFAYVRAHPEIRELILTGGDPWMLSDDRLYSLVEEIADTLPAVRVLRFHTRMPVTLPSRVTDGLLDAIRRQGRLQTVVVTHFNHAQELSAVAIDASARIRGAGILLLNQSVLLKYVNDSVVALKDLFFALGDAGILPYYLHHCDQVAGAEDFRISIERGQEIWRGLRGELPGYLIPEYILDRPGGLGKIPLGDGAIRGVNSATV